MSEFTKSTRRKLRGIGRTAYNRSSLARLAMDYADTPMPHLEGLNVKVFLYDPLAHAGLYNRWDNDLDEDEQTGEGDVEYEMVPDGLECVIKTADGVEVTNWTFKSDEPEEDDEGKTIQLKEDIDPEKYYEVEFPSLINNGEATADISCWVVNGEVGEEDLSEPKKRNTFNVKGHGEYRFRIWLRPKTIVLHWTVGGYEPSNLLNYHFHVPGDDDIRWLPCGAENDHSWRFWWHNLRIRGLPNVKRGEDVEIEINKQLWSESGSNHRGQSYTGSGGDNESSWIRHAGGFNSNSVGVTYCGMRYAADDPNNGGWWNPYGISEIENDDGETEYRWGRMEYRDSENNSLGRWKPIDDNGEPNKKHWRSFSLDEGENEPDLDSNPSSMEDEPDWKWETAESDTNSVEAIPLTKDQILKGISEVAGLCKAWKLDPMDPNDLCTHYEVDYIHTERKQKWDINWLPKDMQDDYRNFVARVKNGEEDDFDSDKYEHLDGYENEEVKLCQNDEGEFVRYDGEDDGIPVGDNWESWLRGSDTPDGVTTDRVSDYLRVLVKKQM